LQFRFSIIVLCFHNGRSFYLLTMGMTWVIRWFTSTNAQAPRGIIYLLIMTLTRAMIVVLARRIIAADLGIWMINLSLSLPPPLSLSLSLGRRVTVQVEKVVPASPSFSSCSTTLTIRREDETDEWSFIRTDSVLTGWDISDEWTDKKKAEDEGGEREEIYSSFSLDHMCFVLRIYQCACRYEHEAWAWILSD